MLLKIIGYLVTALALFIGWQIYNMTLLSPIPPINLIYRKAGVKEEKTKIQPFTINISHQIIDDLNVRLSMTRNFAPPLKDVAFQYGFNTNYLKKVVNFWRTKYDWRSREKYLNSLPQYKIQIGRMNIHYIHVKPQQTKLEVLPIILLHGWPGSVREFYELIPILTTPQPNRDFVFEVIAPSLPGYGFSDIPKEKGYDTAVIATMMYELMSKLGFQKFYVQGGDWGSIIASYLAILHPTAVLGMHSNMCVSHKPTSILKYVFGSLWPSFIADENEIPRSYPVKDHINFLLEESGYFHLQATKPDTIGVALNDSPVGLAAYILEKFSTWTNRNNREHPEGNLEEKYSMTNLLDNVMIYWVTGTITSSMRLYSEHVSRSSASHVLDRYPVIVPTACARFSQEITFQPISILKEKYVNLTRVSDFTIGGHFASFEEPKLMATDIYVSVQKIKMLYYDVIVR